MTEDGLRLLCDEMLQGLGRWLRAAGYDVMIIDDGRSDRALIDLALTTKRILLTRDRGISTAALPEWQVVMLECQTMDQCAVELAQRLGIDWLHAPFSRCLLCNTPLSVAPPERCRRAPEDVRVDRVLYCGHCDKLYWVGSHVRRMEQRLRQWANAASN